MSKSKCRLHSSCLGPNKQLYEYQALLGSYTYNSTPFSSLTELVPRHKYNACSSLTIARLTHYTPVMNRTNIVNHIPRCLGNYFHYILDRVLYARKGDGGEGGEGGQQRTIGGDLIDYETASVSAFNF